MTELTIENMSRPQIIHQLGFVLSVPEFDSVLHRPTEELRALLILRRNQ